MSESIVKTDLEQRLKEKGEAISSRFGKIESKIPGQGLPVIKALKKKPKLSLGIAVGAGLLLGMMLFRRNSSQKQVEYHDGLDRLSDQLAHRIASLLDKGSDSGDAVRKALKERPPIMNMSAESESVVAGAVKQLLKTSMSIVGTELADYLRNRFIGDKPEVKEGDKS